MYLAAMGPPKHTVQIRQHGGKIGVILNSHASSAAPRRGISFFSEPQFREAVPHRRDTRQLPSQRTRPFGLDHLTTRRELWSGSNGCSFDKFILRARGTDFSSESYVGVAKGHMLKPRPLSTGLRDLYRINIGSGPGTGFAGGYHSAATQKSRESAGDAVFGRRSVDRTEGSKKLNSG